jgi:hypothetical protein
MYDLVLKDFRLIKWRLLVYALLFPVLVGSIYSDGSLKGLDMLVIFAFGMPIISLFNKDDAYHSNIIYGSLPYSRNTLIKARYFSIWCSIIVLCIYIVALELALGFLTIENGSVSGVLKKELLLFFAGGLLLNLSIPVIIRFGSKTGFVIVLLVSTTVILFLARLLTGVFMPPYGSGIVTMSAILHGVSGLDSMRMIGCIVGAVLALALSTRISRNISERIFEKMDLR